MSAPEENARRTEQEANRRIARAEADADDARHRGDEKIETIREQYDKREIDENSRQQQILERERLKGYEALRDLQRSQQAELSRVRREGDRDMATLQNYYRDTLYKTDRQGTEHLRELQTNQARELTYETAAKTDELNTARDQHLRQTQETKELQDKKTEELLTTTRKQFEQMRETAEESNTQVAKRHESQYLDRVAQSEMELADVDGRANQALREARQDTARKLSAYTNRQNDPFYQLLDLDARVKDEGDYYELRAKIPSHEQQHVSVSIKGSQLVLSGTRRNEERLEVEPGRVQGTNAFQSYLETFPLRWPVDSKRLSREFQGDELVVRVPKKGDYAYHSPVQEKPARARVDRPKFPENLPIAKADEARGSPQEAIVPVTPARKGRGSSTLG